MHPSRNINDVSSAHGEYHPMFLRQLNSFGSSFLPRSRPPLCRAGFRSSSAASSYFPRCTPAPHPWCSVRGFPPRPPGLPRSHPAARRVFSVRTLHPRGISRGNFGGGWHPFSTSAALMMERPDREPPHKRRKSAEERRSAEETEHRGGGHGATAGKAKDGGSKREHHHRDASTDSRPRPHHGFKDGSKDRGKKGAGKGHSREHSRDKDVERTKDTQRTDETQNRGRSAHQQGGDRGSQPQTPKQDQVPMHRPNAWFKDRGAEEPGASGQPPPTGPSPPVGQQQDARPTKSLQRHWETSPVCSADTQPPGDSAAFDFSVMSYNILSQELLQDNAYLYRHCHPGVLPWDHRLPNLLAEIQQYNADILCLQEVQEDHYENQIKPALQALGYHCEYKKRTGGKPDGCAVVFKTSRLSLLSSNPVEFLRPGDALLDRDNVGLIVLLQPTMSQSDPSAFICVANTHLLYNPRRGDIKLAQLAILLAEINRLSRLPDGATSPVVLCGDFNSTPRSPLYSFLTTGCLKYKGLANSMVSGQENSPRGQRLLTSPLWSPSLGISHQCQYENKPAAEPSSSSPTAVEGAISNLTVEDLATKAAVAVSFNRARIEHSLKLQSSYQHHLKPDGRPEITTCHSRTAMTVDYILYTPEFITPPSLPGGRGLQLLGRLSLVGESEMEEVNGLPNQCHSSDHLPLLALFRLRR